MLDAIILADASSYTSPVTMAYSVIEKVVVKEPKVPQVLSREKKEKFDKMAKEDWIKDDPHADMWDKNWISNVTPIETVEVKPVVINKPPMIIKKKIRSKKWHHTS